MPTTYFVWDPISDNIVREVDENGNVIVDYTTEPGYHGAVISEHRNGETYYHHHDGQGNTRALTDEQGNVTDTFGYTAGGELTERKGTTPTPFRYKGEHGYYTDLQTGEVMARRRPLSPSRGRWLTVAVHGSANLTYSYAANSPLNFAMPAAEILIPLFVARIEKANSSWALAVDDSSCCNGGGIKAKRCGLRCGLQDSEKANSYR